MQKFLPYGSSRISYHSFGNGPDTIICFHGYGESAEKFLFLRDHLPPGQFRVIAIDLPYHGATEWNQKDFTAVDLVSVCCDARLDAAKGNLILLGFSLGGRACLSLYEALPEKINKLVLLAPDGLKLNFWYWLATQSRLGKGLFGFTMKYPGWFLGMLKILNALGLVNSSIYKFVRYYIHDPEVRKQLYLRWTSLRKLKPSIALIKNLIRITQTPVKLVYGKHDRIILARRAGKFTAGIEKFAELKIIESGHQVLHEKHAEEIVNAILH